MEVSNELQAVCDLSPLLSTIVGEFERRVKQLWSFSLHNPDADFAQFEEQARQLSKDCFASALQTAVQLHRTRIEEEWLLGHKHCECGRIIRIMRYKGQQRRTLQTWGGPVTLDRGYFHCPRCAKGRYPLSRW